MAAQTIKYTFTKTLRPATRADFVFNEKILHGTAYYLQSAYSKQFEGPYVLWPESDLHQFAEYMKNEMVFVEDGN